MSRNLFEGSSSATDEEQAETAQERDKLHFIEVLVKYELTDWEVLDKQPSLKGEIISEYSRLKSQSHGLLTSEKVEAFLRKNEGDGYDELVWWMGRIVEIAEALAWGVKEGKITPIQRAAIADSIGTVDLPIIINELKEKYGWDRWPF